MIEIYIGKFRERLYRYRLRRRVKNRNFTLISQNCFAGGVYEDLNIQYKTPIVGLFLYPKCYLNMLENIESINFENIEFISKSKYEQANRYINNVRKYPIAKLDNRDIEIHFLHYNNTKEALDKWIRRSQRINLQNLFIVFSDRDGCTIDEINRFDKLKYKNKVFISSKKYNIESKNIILDIYQNDGVIGDLYNNRWVYRKVFDIAEWLNLK